MTNPHSILIVDGRAETRAALRQTLSELNPVFPHRVVGEADSASLAIDQVAALQPSLVLVNTTLPDMSGIELARRLATRVRTVPLPACDAAPATGPPGHSGQELAAAPGNSATPQFIYVSGSDRYALDAFDVRALDYLLTPVKGARLLQALVRADGSASGSTDRGPGAPAGQSTVARQAVEGQAAQAGATARPVDPLLLSGPARRVTAPAPRRHFAVHERGRLMLVPADQVIYLKAELKYVTVRTRQREYLVEDSLTSLESEFGDRFVRIHRNALVCRACIAGFERVPSEDRSAGAEPHWQVVLRDVPERLAVSRRQWPTVRTLMG